MRIFVSTFIDVPSSYDKTLDNAEGILDNAIQEIVISNAGMNTLSKEAYQLLNNLQVNFADDSDKE